MKVWANLPVWGQSGWEVLSRDIVLSLDKIGVQVALETKDDWNRERIKLDAEDVSRLRRMSNQRYGNMDYDLHILHQDPLAGYFELDFYKKSSAKKVCVSLFETDKCPAPWIPRLNRLDEVWVFSHFNKEGWEKSGVKNVKVMPFAIDMRLFNPKVKSANIKNRKKFMFIANGDFTERKWFEGLIEAFVKEFTMDDDVCLLIKAHYGGFTKEHKEEVKKRISTCVSSFNDINPPMILFMGEKVPVRDMPKFYTAGDCYVLASRGEGLGLPYAEALACGVPVIATGWGGHTEFLNASNSCFVDYSVRIINDLEYLKKCILAANHSWAFPEADSLRERMRFMYEFRDVAKEKGLEGSRQMQEKTWIKLGLWIVSNVLNENKLKESDDG